MLKFKVTTVGASEGLILNKEAKRILNVQKGDTLYLTEAPDGAMRITPHNPEFERQIALAEAILHDDREILRALAK
ncbi:transcriptional regulator [Duganella sp. FT27W]|uniref:transcriptional regulator n=1 Tax=Duganella sp. FT27W TaxID=2654636 RepID=UPI00128D1E28|nr:transcriptional regulator [Duganella sp. FT27W]MPQ58543.1 transcriptional regulator [Duganella sp. FT27W]